MLEILGYITQHYTLFLGGAVLILLAIIGYYADKTNFGQGKGNEDSGKKELLDLNNMRLMDVATNVDNDIKDVAENQNSNSNETLDLNNNLELSQTNNTDNMVQNDNVQNQTNDVLNIPTSLVSDSVNVNIINNSNDLSSVKQPNTPLNELDLVSDLSNVNVSLVSTENRESTFNEESFNKFDEEFNSILPKKDLINSDLLEDINDIELGKTQKLDLNDIPDLDDIELPKIKSMDIDETDIWKF